MPGDPPLISSLQTQPHFRTMCNQICITSFKLALSIGLIVCRLHRESFIFYKPYNKMNFANCQSYSSNRRGYQILKAALGNTGEIKSRTPSTDVCSHRHQISNTASHYKQQDKYVGIQTLFCCFCWQTSLLLGQRMTNQHITWQGAGIKHCSADFWLK